MKRIDIWKKIDVKDGRQIYSKQFEFKSKKDNLEFAKKAGYLMIEKYSNEDLHFSIMEDRTLIILSPSEGNQVGETQISIANEIDSLL